MTVLAYVPEVVIAGILSKTFSEDFGSFFTLLIILYAIRFAVFSIKSISFWVFFFLHSKDKIFGKYKISFSVYNFPRIKLHRREYIAPEEYLLTVFNNSEFEHLAKVTSSGIYYDLKAIKDCGHLQKYWAYKSALKKAVVEYNGEDSNVLYDYICKEGAFVEHRSVVKVKDEPPVEQLDPFPFPMPRQKTPAENPAEPS